jgi:hypothetical protein
VIRRPTRFPVLDADAEIARMFSEATLTDASAAVVSLDERDGYVRGDARSAPFLQVAPPTADGHPFFVRSVANREDRPRNPTKDPLSIDSARERGQHYVVLQMPDISLIALANPYPYLPDSVTWAPLEYVPQRCETEDDWRRALRLTARISEELERTVVGFNETVGNSLSKLHMVSHRQVDGLGPYPVQVAASRIDLSSAAVVTHLGPHNGYYTDVWRVCTDNAEVTAEVAAAVAADWSRVGGDHATANVGAFIEQGRVALYVVPRHRLLTAVGWHSNVAFLEMLGVFIAGQRADFLRVKRGQWDHHHIGRVLSSVRPHGARLINPLRRER